jgi:5-methylthioadenosine/S-adenosylhomocysteine deaminase
MPEPAMPPESQDPASAAGAADLVIRGASVATCDEAWTSHPCGGVAVLSGELVAVGPDLELLPFVGARTEILEARGRILMPGLINTHCHAGDALFRGLVENLPLEAWLDSVWRAERATLTETNTELGAALGFAENVLSGVTTVVDMFWHSDAVVRAARSIGLRVATGGIFFDGIGMDGIAGSERAQRAAEFLLQHAGSPRVIGCVTPHGTYTVGPEGLRCAGRIARDHDALFTTHAAETVGEQELVVQRHGKRVVEHLHDLELLGPRTLLAHGVHLSAGEIELLARTDTTVVHNPLSNLKLGSGIAPVPELLAQGVRVTLGTDGAISGNDTDLWLALRLAATLHKGARQDPTAVSVQEALRMVTLEGARAVGQGHRLGSLEVGKQADLLLLRTDRAHAAPCFDVHNHLVFAAGRGDVDSVWVGGSAIVRGSELISRSLPPLLAEVRRLQPAIRATLAADPS